MKAILFLILYATAATASTLPPLPTVHKAIKRPGPLLSPKHASAQKTVPMVRANTGFRPAGGLVGQRLPMKGYLTKVNSEFGEYELTAEALQPAGQSVLMEMSSAMTEGTWVALAWFGPYPKAQQVFAGITSDMPYTNIRATAGVEPAGAMSRVVVASPMGIRINPDVRGVRAWRGVR